jgi:uncharacterized protein (TIGR03000 family)
LLLSLCLLVGVAPTSRAQGPLYQNIPGGRMTSTTIPETPMVTTPSNLPTYLTSINYPLVYGSYAMWPYAAPLSSTGGGSLPSSLPAISMRPTPVVTKAYAPGLAPPATSAIITVVAPNSADVFFQGMKVPMQGTLRRFASPELNPLLSYTYDVRAVWRQGGQWITQGQRLLVRAGDKLTVTFPKTPAPSVMRYPDLPNPRPAPMPPTLEARPTPEMVIPPLPRSQPRVAPRKPITQSFTPPPGPPTMAPRP